MASLVPVVRPGVGVRLRGGSCCVALVMAASESSAGVENDEGEVLADLDINLGQGKRMSLGTMRGYMLCLVRLVLEYLGYGNAGL